MTTSFSRGQKGKLAELGLNGPFAVTLEIAPGGLEVDVSCFGLDQAGQLSDDRFMVFYNQKSAPGNAVTLDLQPGRAVFQLDLARLPASIDKLVFTAALGGSGSLRALGPSTLTLGPAAAVFAFSGSDFQDEKAIIIGELYRRDGSWRFGAVGQGFAGGLAALLKHFGGTEAQPAGAAPAAPAPAAAEPKKVSLSKIRLEKRGDKVSLDKRDSQGYGRIRVNLNWNRHGTPREVPAAPPTGFIGKLFGKGAAGPASPAGIDLDIGCLFEMSNGAKSAVQALGNTWGAYERPPYIHLEGDDRTGSVSSGENLYINGAHFDQIKRVLIYAFIYEGVPNWAATDGIVTIEVPGQPVVEVQLDNGNNQPMCAIAMLENHGGNLQISKLVEYFGGRAGSSAHREMDQRFGFGLNWTAGRKD